MNPANAAASLVIGSNHKESTVEVYDLSGRRLPRITTKGTNNIDVRPRFLGVAERHRTALGEPAAPAFLLADAPGRHRSNPPCPRPEDFSIQKAKGRILAVDEALALVSTRLRNSR